MVRYGKLRLWILNGITLRILRIKKNMKINQRETARIRSAMAAKKSIKITINIDAQTLQTLRSVSEQTGVPYQRLMNRLLKESLERNGDTTSRLSRLEREVKALKKKIAA